GVGVGNQLIGYTAGHKATQQIIEFQLGAGQFVRQQMKFVALLGNPLLKQTLCSYVIGDEQQASLGKRGDNDVQIAFAVVGKSADDFLYFKGRQFAPANLFEISLTADQLIEQSF